MTSLLMATTLSTPAFASTSTPATTSHLGGWSVAAQDFADSSFVISGQLLNKYGQPEKAQTLSFSATGGRVQPSHIKTNAIGKFQLTYYQKSYPQASPFFFHVYNQSKHLIATEMIEPQLFLNESGSVAFGGGYIYVAETGGVFMYTPTGKLVKRISITFVPQASVYQGGNLYVVDKYRPQVTIINPISTTEETEPASESLLTLFQPPQENISGGNIDYSILNLNSNAKTITIQRTNMNTGKSLPTLQTNIPFYSNDFTIQKFGNLLYLNSAIQASVYVLNANNGKLVQWIPLSQLKRVYDAQKQENVVEFTNSTGGNSNSAFPQGVYPDGKYLYTSFVGPQDLWGIITQTPIQ